MYRYSLPLALLALTALASSVRAQQSVPQTKRWTNADMNDLRTRGLISIVGQETEAAPQASPVAQGPVYANRLEDPAWYAEQAADLQAQLTARQSALAAAQANLEQGRSLRGTTGAINMLAGDTYGVTPEEAIGEFQAQVVETQTQLDELANLARLYEIPPGVVRSATT